MYVTYLLRVAVADGDEPPPLAGGEEGAVSLAEVGGLSVGPAADLTAAEGAQLGAQVDELVTQRVTQHRQLLITRLRRRNRGRVTWPQ